MLAAHKKTTATKHATEDAVYDAQLLEINKRLASFEQNQASRGASLARGGINFHTGATVQQQDATGERNEQGRWTTGTSGNPQDAPSARDQSSRNLATH